MKSKEGIKALMDNYLALKIMGIISYRLNGLQVLPFDIIIE